jgi:hypothetical protein
MISQMQGIAFGILTLVVLVGISLVVLTNLGHTAAQCNSGFTYSSSAARCLNNTLASDNATALGAAYTSFTYGITQLGSTGLLAWLPAIIALLVGVFFLSYFAGKKDY